MKTSSHDTKDDELDLVNDYFFTVLELQYKMFRIDVRRLH